MCTDVVMNKYWFGYGIELLIESMKASPTMEFIAVTRLCEFN